MKRISWNTFDVVVCNWLHLVLFSGFFRCSKICGDWFCPPEDWQSIPPHLIPPHCHHITLILVLIIVLLLLLLLLLIYPYISSSSSCCFCCSSFSLKITSLALMEWRLTGGSYDDDGCDDDDDSCDDDVSDKRWGGDAGLMLLLLSLDLK